MVSWGVFDGSNALVPVGVDGWVGFPVLVSMLSVPEPSAFLPFPITVHSGSVASRDTVKSHCLGIGFGRLLVVLGSVDAATFVLLVASAFGGSEKKLKLGVPVVSVSVVSIAVV